MTTVFPNKMFGVVKYAVHTVGVHLVITSHDVWNHLDRNEPLRSEEWEKNILKKLQTTQTTTS